MGDPSVIVTLVGTKMDLSHKRTVSEQRGRTYARNNGLLYAETSSHWSKQYLTGRGSAGKGIENIIIEMVQAIVQQQRQMGHNPLRLDMGYCKANQIKIDAIDLVAEDFRDRGCLC